MRVAAAQLVFCTLLGCGAAHRGSATTPATGGASGSSGTSGTAGTSGGAGGGAAGSSGGATLGLLAGALGGPGFADGAGAAARLLSGAAALSDGAGNLFVIDGYMIRRVAIATGEVTALAGSRVDAGSVDGVGPDARFTGPAGLAADGAGHLFVTDGFAIRQVVVATGAVTTLAGGPLSGAADGAGAAASFSLPIGIAADRAGNLFIVDSGACTIRKLVIATGSVTTVAGTPFNNGNADGTGAAASFYTPEGVVADGAGNLFVTDATESTVRKIVLSTGAVTTFAGIAGSFGSVDGTGTAAVFNHPIGLTLDVAGNLFVADNLNHSVRKIQNATAAVTTIAGAPTRSGSSDGPGDSASLNQPNSITFDPSGALFVTDGSYTVRRIALDDGVVSTVVGQAPSFGTADGVGATARFHYPGTIVSDGAGSLFVNDAGNHLIRRVDAVTGEVTTLAGSPAATTPVDGTGTAAGFGSLAGLAIDSAGNLFVSEGGRNLIRQVVIATGTVTTLAGGGSPGAYGPPYVDGIGKAASFNAPRGLAADGEGNLFVADAGDHRIRKIVIATGAVTTVGPTFKSPTSVASDHGGNLFIADDETIQRLVIATGASTPLAGSAGLSGAADGTGTSATFNNPWGLVFDGAGGLFVADAGSSLIRRVAIATGEVTTVVGSPGPNKKVVLGQLPAALNTPVGIAVGVGGALFISDEQSLLVAR